MNRVFVDFQKSDRNNGNLVPTVGTREDLARHGIELSEGIRLDVFDEDSDGEKRDDLIATVVAEWEPVGQRWTLRILEETWCHESDVRLSREAAEEEAWSGP